MESRDEASAAVGQQRWICEACGCNTNSIETNPATCSICGSARQVGLSALLEPRREDLTSSQLLRRSFFLRRRGIDFPRSLNPRELMRSQMGNGGVALDEDGHAAASLALEAASIPSAAVIPGSRSRRDLLLRQASNDRNQSANDGVAEDFQQPPLDDLLVSATENSASYNPTWATAEQLGMNNTAGYSIEVSSTNHPNIALLPGGGSEGRSVRANEPIPRDGLPTKGRTGATRRGRHSVGFRICFSRPHRETGKGMGGGYLIGVTTSAFTAFNERNALQQSPFFWGVDDGGNKYEGPNSGHSYRGTRRVSSHGTEMNNRDAPRNAEGVLFGCREVVTVIYDVESRSLSFWRDNVVIGTLVHGIPRAGAIFPVAVPYNAGVIATITGMQSDPLAGLLQFVSAKKLEKLERQRQLRNELAEQRALIVQDGTPTNALKKALHAIFSMYCSEPEDAQPSTDVVSAARLWYRSGIKLSQLDSVIQQKTDCGPAVTFDDFLVIISQILHDDTEHSVSGAPSSDLDSSTEATSGCERFDLVASYGHFKVGDVVELNSGYEKHGDASRGPMAPGDRGQVVEIQEGPGGERQSVRVLFNGRRWWYQPQALLSERSGLIETPACWLIRRLLRSHGFDHVTLEPLWGKSLTSTSWRAGDIVIPSALAKKCTEDGDTSNVFSVVSGPCVGRIVASPEQGSQPAQPNRAGNIVHVEFVDPKFADLVGCSSGTENASGSRVHEVEVNKLTHAGITQRCYPESQTENSVVHGEEQPAMKSVETTMNNPPNEGPSEGAAFAPQNLLHTDIAGVSRLDLNAMERVARDCQEGFGVLARAFSSGLREAIIAGFDRAEELGKQSKNIDSLSPSVTALGNICVVIARRLCLEEETVLLACEDGGATGMEEANVASDLEISSIGYASPADSPPVNAESAGMGQETGPRENILLSLMSGARLNETALSNDARNPENQRARAIGARYVIPTFREFHESSRLSPFLRNQRNEFAQTDTWNRLARVLGGPGRQGRLHPENRSWASGDSQPPGRGATGSQGSSGAEAGAPSTAQPQGLSRVHSIRRGGFETEGTETEGRKPVVINAAARSAIANGILANNHTWFKRVVENAKKRKSAGSMQHSPLPGHPNSRDSDGMSFLMLAVSLGCSKEIVNMIIQSGASVGEAELKKAAYTDQHQILELLLEHCSCLEGVLDVSKCSPRVTRVIELARLRHNDQEDTLRKEGESFLCQVIEKIMSVALSCLSDANQKILRRSLGQILVGRVLLKAMFHYRQTALIRLEGFSGRVPKKRATDSDNGRVPIFSDSESRPGTQAKRSYEIASDEGVLFLAGNRLLCKLLAQTAEGSAVTNTVSYVLLLEAMLWSKDVEDVAVGLTMTCVLLGLIPDEIRAPLVDRFGIVELVAFHHKQAELTLAAYEKSRAGMLSSPTAGARGQIQSSVGDTCALVSSGVVLCPRFHPAELHITKHNSFRCDLCGKGIERGYPMHGCRECDWDACEDCINKKEGGLVKWEHVRNLAIECLRILNDPDPTPSSGTVLLATVPELSDSSVELSPRIRSGDEGALTELARAITLPGKISMFEFASNVIPALYEALVGSSLMEHQLVALTEPSKDRLMRKNKKQRVSLKHEDVNVVDIGQRLSFQGKAVYWLIVEPLRAFFKASESGLLLNQKQDEQDTASDSADHNQSDEEVEFSEPLAGRQKKANTNIKSLFPSPELIRRLHEVIALHEKVSNGIGRSCGSSSLGSDLQSLTTPLELELIGSKFGQVKCNACEVPFVIHAEPLMPVSELCQHLLRGTRVCLPKYTEFCRRLCKEKAIIIERPKSAVMSKHDEHRLWQLAQVISFDPETGSHVLRYASSVIGCDDSNAVINLEDNATLMKQIKFEGKEPNIVLSAREFFVLHRQGVSWESDADYGDALMEELPEFEDVGCLPEHVPGSIPIGTRVECKSTPLGDSWHVCTVVGQSTRRPEIPEWNRTNDQLVQYHVVSDDGVAIKDVESGNVRGYDLSLGRSQNRRPGAQRQEERGGEVAGRLGSRLGLRRFAADSNDDPRSSHPKVGVLKRTWSALSPMEAMAPVDLKVEEGERPTRLGKRLWNCSVGNSVFGLECDESAVENPPLLRVKFSYQEFLPTADLASRYSTIFSAVRALFDGEGNINRLPTVPGETFTLYYSVEETVYGTDINSPLSDQLDLPLIQHTNPFSRHAVQLGLHGDPRSAVGTNLSSFLEFSKGESGRYEGLDPLSVKCIEIIDCLSMVLRETSAFHHQENETKTNCPVPAEAIGTSFVSESLTRKLMQQLDETLTVAGGALPKWCTAVPSMAPSLFSYASRRLLLERAAFGVSRSTLRQQEAKVNVAPLRQRMAALRGRAVELVGEAFSGGAEDPTALQLQADELYGMEEALAARVSAAFRAQKWQERSLDSAKAAVRREKLLNDAATIMERYTSDVRVRQRRLEVRFHGESGFDAASGNEAGVTRGFYADVAEALLSCDHVAGVQCSPDCGPAVDRPFPNSMPDLAGAFSFHGAKLPLWIPDMDSSCTVVIPTPRANPQSSLGVFPRPLQRQDPSMDAVKAQFRFMGRVFAAAMRDGFMFPLPLSSSFLKLVQGLCTWHGSQEVGSIATGSSDHSFSHSTQMEIQMDDDASMGENSPPTSSLSGNYLSPNPQTPSSSPSPRRILTSADLPRPGFLGGEVFAAETAICSALDKIDFDELSKEEADKRVKAIASDVSFARQALGKSYDCSFEDYFQDRTFVDPLDPSQGGSAVPLCTNGALRAVTIYNIREWVSLAKEFILFDGVIEQAFAFCQGINDFYPTRYLCLFTPQEIQRDVCGGGDNVETWSETDIKKLFKLDGGKGATEALVAVAAIGGEGGATLSRRFSSSSPTIGFLVETLLKSSTTQRRQFLNFVTSVPIVTPRKIEVVPIISPSGDFLPVSDSCLPRANTCARKLYLPKFEDFQSFSEVLWAVIREESKFKGFYEWRG